MSITGLLGLYISTVPIVYAVHYPDPLAHSAFFCWIQYYLRHALNELMRTFFVLACADRYASSSKHVNIRAYSRLEVAKRVIPSVSIFWSIVAVFPTMLRTLSNGVCGTTSGILGVIYGIYVLITLGILPLVGLSVFGILMIKNLKQMRRSVQPTATLESQPNNLRRRDRDMIRMLLAELISYIITTIPNTVMQIYVSAAADVVKTKARQEIETFAAYFAQVFLLYMMNTFAFWIYLSTSRTFRTELKTMLIRWYRAITCQRNNQ
jgi:hypothetical protein